MNEAVELLEERNRILQQFLEITKLISNCLSELETMEQLRQVEKLVDQRGELIEKAGEIAAALKKYEEEHGEQTAILEQYKWRSVQLLEDTQKLEKENAGKMDDVMKDYMKKVRTTKESIRVIDAYKQASPEDFSSSFNKTK